MKYAVPIYYECLSTVTVDANSQGEAYQKVVDNIQCLREDCNDIQTIFASKEYRENSMDVDGGADSITEIQ